MSSPYCSLSEEVDSAHFSRLCPLLTRRSYDWRKGADKSVQRPVDFGALTCRGPSWKEDTG
jgi:hypothetical protein